MGKKLNILYCSTEERGRVWKQRIEERHPNIHFSIWPDVGDLTDIDILIVWKVPKGLLKKLVNLKAIFTVSAGVDQIDFSDIPDHVSVVRMIDNDLSDQLAEYASMSVLMLYRRAFDYLENQKQQRWQEFSVPSASRIRVGVMGLGQQGRKILDRLKPFNFQLSGWSKSGNKKSGVTCFAEHELAEFLSSLDILICVLPLTSETQGILNSELFRLLPQGCSIINMGRGEHLVSGDLLAALDSGQIGRAILDVTEQEPLDTESPLWLHPKIMITPHIAGSTRADSAFNTFETNVLKWMAGEDLEGLVSRNRGY
ncbi:2-hydroxyacid dehydrogenase [Vibrio sp. FJH11]